MPETATTPNPDKVERVDVSWDYAVCAWARHFNASEKQVKEAVAAVGGRAGRGRGAIGGQRQAGAERPSGN